MSFEEWFDQHYGASDPDVVKAGNIDLGNRPAVYNEDGTVSTERSFSIGDEYGRETLLPQVVGGKMLSEKDAIKHYEDTGEHLGIYKDIPTAKAYAERIHNRTPRLDTPDAFPVGEVMQSIRDLPGWAAYRMYRGATRKDLPWLPPGFSTDNARANLKDLRSWANTMAGGTPEGLSAREEAQQAGQVTAPLPLPPFLNPKNYSLHNAGKNLRDLRDYVLPPDKAKNFHPIDDLMWLGREAMKPSPPPPPEPPPWSWDKPSAWDRFKNEMSPPNLLRGLRQGILPDESLDAIKQDPYSLDSLLSYASAAISLSGGKGAEGEGMRGVMPKHMWDSLKPLDVGPGKTYIKGQGGEIRVDPAGNHLQLEGSHYDEATGQTHMIVNPVDPPGAPKGYSDQTFLPTENPEHMGTWKELGEGQKNWFYDQWKQGKTPTMQDMMDSLYGKGAGTEGGVTEQPNPFYKFMTGNEPPPEAPGVPSEPLKPEEGSMWDEWAKKHGGLKPDFGAPEEPPKDWGNAFDRKYSSPLGGQTWADIYATPDMEFTVGPQKPPDRGPLGPLEPNVIQPYEPPGLTSYNPRNPPNLPPPPGVDPLDSMLSEWAKFMDKKGIDYQKQINPPKEDMFPWEQPPENQARAAADWLESLKAGDITQEQYDAAIEAIKNGELPPMTPDYGIIPPEGIDVGISGVRKDSDDIADWWKEKPELPMQEWRKFWKPPEE